MSTQEPAHDDTTMQTDALVRQAAPLSPLEAHEAEEEAIHRALETSEAFEKGHRRGKVEAETHRLSEEMTRQAQARLRAQARAVPPPPAP